MNKFNDFLIQRENKNMSWDISNLTEEQTGLPFVILVGSGNEALKYPARIRIVKSLKWIKGEEVIIQIEGSPKIIGKNNLNLSKIDLEKIIKWVDINKDVIMQFWNTEISTKTMVNSIISHKE